MEAPLAWALLASPSRRTPPAAGARSSHAVGKYMRSVSVATNGRRRPRAPANDSARE